MSKHGMSGYRQAEPGSTTTDGASTAINSLYRIEAFKDPREVGAIYANSVINDGNL
jgi:hypothetical protein